jgi:hypothetical protein
LRARVFLDEFGDFDVARQNGPILVAQKSLKKSQKEREKKD